MPSPVIQKYVIVHPTYEADFSMNTSVQSFAKMSAVILITFPVDFSKSEKVRHFCCFGVNLVPRTVREVSLVGKYRYITIRYNKPTMDASHVTT